MGQDIFVADFPKDAKTIEDIPHGFKLAVLPERSKLIAMIQEVVPGADFSDPTWGIISGEGWGIEVNLSMAKGHHDGFTLHVHGGDDPAWAVVTAILQHLKLRGVHGASGEFLDCILDGEW